MRRILPPVLFVFFVIAMGVVCWGMESTHNIASSYILIGLPFVIVGLGFAVAGKVLFRKIGTNIMTFNEPDVLVTEGLFKYTRNPMYLGLFIAMFGFFLLMGAAITSFVLTSLFWLIVDRWYIAFEEEAMHRKFGLDYEEYCRKVRRWI